MTYILWIIRLSIAAVVRAAFPLGLFFAAGCDFNYQPLCYTGCISGGGDDTFGRIVPEKVVP
ncbi:MAG: hypothetical protein [Microvirus sp.]|nr:MAG: hypothetical protein [Microvirus sp.]